jgi:hypothetical protein
VALQYVTLTGSLGAAAGPSATAVFTPSGWLTDPADSLLVPPAPVVVGLPPQGSFSVRLLATDNTAATPAGWWWSVTFSGISGVVPRTFSFFLAYAGGATQDISTLAPIVPSPAMGAYLPVAGGTMTGPLTLAASPASALGAATKQYVDAQAGRVDWVSVVAYGADPTGAADSSPAFASAIAAGKCVYAPAGTYKLLSGASLTEKHVLRGAGMGVTILSCPTANINVVQVNGSSGAGEIEYPGVEDLSIAGPSTGTGHGLHVSWSTTVSRFRNLIVAGAGDSGVFLANTYNALLENIHSTANGGDGFEGLTAVNAVKHLNCLATLNGRRGFRLNGGAGATYDGCTAESNVDHGFSFTNMYGGGISAGDSEGNGTNGTGANVYVGANCYTVKVDAISVSGDGVTHDNVVGDGGVDCRYTGISYSGAAGGVDFKLTANEVRPRFTQPVALSHTFTMSDASGTGVYDTSANMAALLSGPSAAADMGLVTQTFDPVITPVNVSTGMVNYTAGVVFLTRINLRQAVVSGKKLYCWWVQPTGGSPANSFFGLVDSTGARLAVSADLTSTVSQQVSVTLPALPAGVYFGAAVIGTQGSTQAGGVMYATGAAGVVSANFASGNGLGPASYRAAKQLAGQTSLPSSLTLASNTTSVVCGWYAIG